MPSATGLTTAPALLRGWHTNPTKTPTVNLDCTACQRLYTGPCCCLELARNLEKNPPVGRLSTWTKPVPTGASSCSRSCCSSSSRRGTSSGNDGRCAGLLCQQDVMISTSGGGVCGGGVGRSPCCTTPTAACRAQGEHWNTFASLHIRTLEAAVQNDCP
jgi:hypothetical protein